MLLVVQLVWVLVQRSDYFLLSVHTCIDRFGQGCLYERSGYGGRLFIARCRVGSLALWIKVRD